MEKKKYIEARKLHQELCTRMMNYFSEYEDEFRSDITERIHRLHKKERLSPMYLSFDFDYHEDNQVFGDLIIYPHGDDFSISNFFLIDNRVRAKRKLEMMKSIMNSKLGLFKFVKANEDETYVFENVLTYKQVTVTDLSIKNFIGIENFYLFDRVIEFDGISFFSGVHLCFKKSDPEIRKWIKRNKGKYRPTSQLLELFVYFKRVH